MIWNCFLMTNIMERVNKELIVGIICVILEFEQFFQQTAAKYIKEAKTIKSNFTGTNLK